MFQTPAYDLTYMCCFGRNCGLDVQKFT